MNHFERVTSNYADLPYMRERQAKIMRDLIIEHEAQDILEIGFYHGKSSAYFAAILEDMGRGHLSTIDREGAQRRSPNIEEILASLDLAHRVTPIYAHRSYTWELGRMIQASPRPQFDFCYFDGGHTWDGTGFGLVLVDMLLRPGGWIVFDDIPWTVAAAMKGRSKVPHLWKTFDANERATPAVKLVFDLLVPHLGYTNKRTINGGQWGIARKPLEGSAARPGRRGRLGGLLNRIGVR